MNEEASVLNRVIDTMSRLGVKPNEAEVYLKLIESGPATISIIARRTGIPRATVHRHVESLLDKGIVSQTFKGESRIIVAEDPLMLEGLLMAKESELKNRLNEVSNLRNNFTDLIKDINSLAPTNASNQVKFRYYEGKRNVQLVYRQVLKSTKIYSFVNVNRVSQSFPENPALFKEAMHRNSEMEMWEIIEQSKDSVNNASSIGDRYYYKYIPEDVDFFDLDFIVCDNKLILINLDKPISALVITSEPIVQSLLVIHKLVWRLLN